MPQQHSPLNKIRPEMVNLSPNMIRDIADLCFDKEDAIMLCFGESDEPTPQHIKDAAIQSLTQNDTFYTPNSGVPQLRKALSQYMERLYDTPVSSDRITVTTSGMSAIMLAMQALINPGDEVIVVGPVWPNVNGSIRVLSGNIVDVALGENAGQWSLDLDHLFDSCTSKTRAIFLNSPNNPTGWTLHRHQQQAILEFCRLHGIWIICDDVYARLVFNTPLADSFVQIADPNDLVIAINSFSKTWSMTGWRLGWLTAPAQLTEIFAKLNEFNVAAPTTFVQHAGIAALSADSDPYVESLVCRLRSNSDLVMDALCACSRVSIASPPATFYSFFAVDGVTDSMAFAKKLLRETGVALAPGAAFGAAGKHCMRMCFAKSESTLAQALERLVPVLS